MKKTKKLILGSALAIGFCTSLMVGTTYALFTSESEVNIAVTSANVSLSAKVDANSVYTKQIDTEYQAGVLGTYCGNVKVEENGDVTFANVVTGDAIKFDIVMTNTSSIAVKYRTAWECDNAEMLKSLTFKVNNAVCVAGTGLWKPLAVGEAPEKLTVEIEMNDVADATVQHTCKLAFRVEAVQGNGGAINNVSSAKDYMEVAKIGGNILLVDSITFDNKTDGDFNDGKTVNVDLNGKTMNGNNGNITTRVKSGVVTFSNGTITAKQGTYCTVSAAAGGIANIKNMTLNNSTAYGMSVKIFTDGVANLYDTVLVSELGGGATAAGGELNIYEGCIFTQTVKYDHNSCNVSASEGGIANIYGGTFKSDNYGIYVYNSGATINIRGGSFTAAEAVLKADKSTTEVQSVINVYDGSFDGKLAIANGATLNIHGGTFKNTGLALDVFKNYVAEGLTVEESEIDGVTVYTVIQA